MIKYDTRIDPTAENTSHARIVDLVGTDHDVLDVGCATGYLARELARRGNRVSGVERDPASAEVAREHVEDLVIADLESSDLVAAFGAGRFDVLVFGDVLEHLSDPADVLRRAMPLLRRGGSVVVSIPNVAHGSVRLALLTGQWRYRSLGLLDDTHVRFFDRQGVEDLLRGAGLVPVDLRRTTAPPLETEVTVDPERLPDGVLGWVEADAEAWTYQFVWRAVRSDDAEGAVAQLERHRAEMERTLTGARQDTDAWRSRAEGAQAALDALQARLTAAEDRACAVERQLADVDNLKVMRLTRPVRAWYSRWRARPRG